MKWELSYFQLQIKILAVAEKQMPNSLVPFNNGNKINFSGDELQMTVGKTPKRCSFL